MSIRRYLGLCLAICLLPVVAAHASAQAPVVVTGRVVAAETGQPVADAQVRFEGTSLSGTTNASGEFSIPAVPPAVYTVVVEREGFETVRATVTVGAGVNPPLEVRLPFALGLREDVSVVGRTVGDLGLAGQAATASRLNLKPIEIPASVDILDSSVMEARGYQKVSDAVGRMAGVVAGEHPTAPSSFTMRGFTSSQVATLRDGIWLGPSPMVMRPQNTFNLDRIELMRGPSSVVNGQGSVAGAVNAVTKAAEPTTATSGNALLSYGRFDTSHVALGVTGPIADTLWYRVDASRSGSDGYAAAPSIARPSPTASPRC
jgi:outer membrane receptor protein involved in Fe transport